MTIMTNGKNYNKIEFCARAGTVVGICWFLSFLAVIHSLHFALLSLLGLFLALYPLKLMIFTLDVVRAEWHHGRLLFGRLMLTTLTILCFASVCMGTFVFLYMSYLDGGSLAAQYKEMMALPEQQTQMDALLQGSGLTTDDLTAWLSALRPIHFAWEIIRSNFIMSLLSTPFIAAVSCLVWSYMERKAAKNRTNKPNE